MLITTFERDSIWHEDGIVVVRANDADTAARTIELRGRKYRYREISVDEVLGLFTKPLGKIPISRPMLPRAEVPGPMLEELVSNFKSMK